MNPRHPRLPVRTVALTVLACLSMSSLAQAQTATPPAAADAVRGANLYERRCSACHSIAVSRIGPLHRGVVGRRAGTVPGYAYSTALRTSGLTWTAANLDRFLTGPTRMVPGTKMGLSVAAPADRRDIIAYLATQRAPATRR